jgi:hypothetical protein
MNKELIYKEDALKQLRLNDKDVIYIDKQEAAERIRKLNAINIFTEHEKYNISKVYQNYYCMGIDEIAEEDSHVKSIFEKIGLL